MIDSDRVLELEKEVESLRSSPASDDLQAQLQVAQAGVDEVTAEKDQLQKENRLVN